MEPTLPSVAHCGGTLGALVEAVWGGIEQSATAQGVVQEAKREGGRGGGGQCVRSYRG